MGRGRAKAKQTKVARDLKYRHQDIDVNALAHELHGSAPEPPAKEESSGATESESSSESEDDDWSGDSSRE